LGVERYISIVVGRMARLERASYNGTAGGGDEGKKGRLERRGVQINMFR